MANIGKTSNSKYIQSQNYSNRSRFVNESASVQKVTSIQSANNDHLRSSTNQLFNFDQFYELLQVLKKEYKSYFQNKREFDDNLKAFKKEKRHIMRLLDSLIKSYNLVMESLVKFDETYKTDYRYKVESLIILEKQTLVDAAIDVYGDHTLLLNLNRFNRIFSGNLDNLEPLIKVEEGFFEKVFIILYSVRVKKIFTESNELEDAYAGKILDIKG